MTQPIDPRPGLVPGISRADDLAILAAGGYTGWWDEHGQPAPWPDDFFDPDSPWRSTESEEPLTPDPGQPPF